MKIAIDVLSLAKFTNGEVRTAGGGKYAKMLIKYISKIDKKNYYFIFIPQRTLKEFLVKAPNFKFIECTFASKSLYHRLFWEQTILPFVLRDYDIDILYICSNVNVFLAPCKTIIRIGNMAPYSYEVIRTEKSLSSKLRLLILQYLSRISSQKVKIILTLSKTAEKELHKKGFPKNKTRSILHGVNIENLKGGKLNDNLQRILSQKFILCVSHIDRYKRLENLIAAYHLVLQDRYKIPDLVIVGAPRDVRYLSELKKFIQKNKISDKVHFLGYINRKNLYIFYTSCQFLVFTSIVETFPNTLVEAMKCGVAILCSNKSVMPEIGGNAVLYFDPNNVGETAEKIDFLLKNNIILNKLRRKSRKQGEKFNWEKTAQETLALFEEVYYSSS